MNQEVGLLPVAHVAQPRPSRVGLAEGLERREGRMRIGAQGRPLERKTLVRIVGRSRERRERYDIALPVGQRRRRERGRKRRRLTLRGGVRRQDLC